MFVKALLFYYDVESFRKLQIFMEKTTHYDRKLRTAIPFLLQQIDGYYSHSSKEIIFAFKLALKYNQQNFNCIYWLY